MPYLFKIAHIADVPPGSSKLVEADEQLLALFNIDGTLYAIDDACPHEGTPLSDGEIRGCVVTCPRHGWQFDVTSGKQILPRGNLMAESSRVVVEGTDVFVEL